LASFYAKGNYGAMQVKALYKLWTWKRTYKVTHDWIVQEILILLCTMVSVLTYEVSRVVLRHHSQANITEEVHYFVNISEVGGLWRERKRNTIICAISVYCSLQKQHVIPIIQKSFPCYSVVCCSENHNSTGHSAHTVELPSQSHNHKMLLVKSEVAFCSMELAAFYQQGMIIMWVICSIRVQ
jgi:hypothetical protein